MKISVRHLIEFVYKSGDISFEFTGPSRNLEGIKGHQKIQNSRGAGYQAEVALEHTFDIDGLTITIGGRLDGVWETEESLILEEIKTTTQPLDEILAESYFLHWAQVRTYAYIYMLNHELTEVVLQLTYYNIDNRQVKEFRKAISFKEGEDSFRILINRYLDFAKAIEKRKTTRDLSIKSLAFPFPEYRTGQRPLAVSVYKTIENQERLFFQAATGIGKTAAVIFPAVKALEKQLCDKVFYLTAKTMGKSIAEDFIRIMTSKGLSCLVITITAKEKICFQPGSACHPDECDYAKGHYDRVQEGIWEGLEETLVTRQKVIELSKKFRLCPFEFTLDLALWADMVICDYNYAFDPRVFLRRFFVESPDRYTFLIDEAHNLVDRSRDMHSAELFKDEFLKLRRYYTGKIPSLHKCLTKINSFLLRLKRELKDENRENRVLDQIPEQVLTLLRQFSYSAETALVKGDTGEKREELIKLYFDTAAFLRIAELFDDRFVFYYEKQRKNDLRIKIFCLDPSQVMKENLKKAKSSVFFSATMTPLDYYSELLGGEKEDKKRIVNSPFPIENRAVLICPRIVTLYKKRKESRSKLVEYLKAVLSVRKGNYLIYFSSYEYLDQVLELFTGGESDDELLLQVVQRQNMTEESREEYLRNFTGKDEKNRVGFAVLGGVFSEGIDLIGEDLIGALIVGVGLPQISLEQELIKEFFEKKNGKGFAYAYRFPGMNRVLQAAGRVIRSEQDRGIIVLFDSRYSYRSYKELFPHEWRRCRYVDSAEEAVKLLNGFWGKSNSERDKEHL